MAQKPVLHEIPGDYHGTCGGKDEIDTNCYCTDLQLTIRIHIKSGSTLGRSWSCRCCGLHVDMDRYLGQSPA